MSTPARYDVLVVGGRVAGASTALLLARAGLRVAVLDRSAHGSDTLSTHALMRTGVLQLSRWGVLEDLVAAGTPPVRRTLFHYPGDEPVQVSIRRSAGVDALYAPRRHLLDRLLVDAATAAGADVSHEVAVTGLLRDDSGRVVGVRACGRDGREHRLRATVTVGADGIRSLVAQQAGAPVVHQGRTAGAVLYRYVADLPTAGYEWAYGAGCAAGLIPTDDGETCVFVSTAPAAMRELRRAGTESAFATLLDAAAPGFAARVAAAGPGSRMRGWAGVPGFVRRPGGPGWALVGDAGYFKDPITTHGITDALRDAELLADALLDSVAGTPEAVALARYQRTRDRLSRGLVEATEQIAGYDWRVDRVQGLLREVSAAMSDELDLLQGRPDRRVGRGFPAFVGPDSAAASG